MVGALCLLLSFVSLVIVVWGIVTVDWVPMVAGVGGSTFFANAAGRILSPRVVVDDRGVAWRMSPWNSGVIEWSDIVDVTTYPRPTEMGGGMHLPAAQLVLRNGRSVEIARGTFFQGWRHGEMIQLAQIVRDRLRTGGRSS